MARTTLYLVRHGEQDVTHGHGDTGLTPTGRDQADRLGRRLGLTGVPFTRLHHSPLRRAAETAAILGAYLPGLPAHACDHVADRTPVPAVGDTGNTGDTDGYPERYRGWLDAAPAAERDPGATALRAAVSHLGAVGDTDRAELVVTHAFVVGWFVRHVLDAPTWRWLGLNPANCALTIVSWDADRPAALIAFNDTGHLSAGHAAAG